MKIRNRWFVFAPVVFLVLAFWLEIRWSRSDSEFPPSWRLIYKDFGDGRFKETRLADFSDRVLFDVRRLDDSIESRKSGAFGFITDKTMYFEGFSDLGEMKRGADEVVVVDLEKGTILDRFRGNHPVWVSSMSAIAYFLPTRGGSEKQNIYLRRIGESTEVVSVGEFRRSQHTSVTPIGEATLLVAGHGNDGVEKVDLRSGNREVFYDDVACLSAFFSPDSNEYFCLNMSNRTELFAINVKTRRIRRLIVPDLFVPFFFDAQSNRLIGNFSRFSFLRLGEVTSLAVYDLSSLVLHVTDLDYNPIGPEVLVK